MEMFRHLFSCDKTRWSAHEFVDDRKDKRSLQWTTTHGHGYSGMMSQNPNGHNGQNCISRKKRRIKIGDLSSTSSSSSSSSWVQGGCGGKDRKRSMKNSWTRKWTSGECSGELGVDELTWKQQSGSGLSTRLLYMIVILISTASYWNSFNGDFVHDDLSAIKTNGDVTGQNSIWDIFFNDFWGKPMADRTSHKSYRPLTILSFRLNNLIHDLEPMGFHVFNVILHATVTAIFVKMCLEVARTSKTSALFAGLHFATHPIHTEAVTGVVGRADLLAALFVLISFLCYDRYQKQVENKRLILTSILLAFGGMLSKEHGITVLGINLTWDVYLNRYLILNYFLTRKINAKMYNLFRRIFIIGLGGLAFVTFRIVMLQGSLPQFSDQDNPASFAPCKVTRFRTFVYLPAFNFWLLLAPISLNYDWQMGSIPLVDKWTDIRNIPCLVFYTTLSWTVVYLGFKTVKLDEGALLGCSNWEILFRVISTVVFLMLWFFQSKTRRDVVVALSFLIIPFIPASNLLFRVGFVVAERVLYIPSLGFSLLVGAGAERIMMMQKSYMKINLTKICFMLILTLFTYKTWIRNEDWRSRESLFTSGLRLLPHNAKMHYNYANLQKDLGNTEQAISHYRIALQLWPHHASAHNNLGTLLNDTAAAESHFQKALKINPIHARAYFNLSLLRYQQGKTKIAIRLMERSLELEPDNPDALTNLAAMESDLGHFDRAKEIHLKILELEPNNADHLNNYAAFLQRIGLNSEALQMYEAALARDGNHTVALVNTARLMKKLKFNEKAESLYQRALERNPDDAVVKVNLAQTYVHQRKYNEAESLLLTVMEQSNSSRREVFHQLATLYSQHLNRTNDAFRYLKMAVETCLPFDITCAPLYALTGDLYKDIDDLDSAILSYKQAVETLNRANATECCPQQKYPLSSSIVTHVHLNLGAIYHVKGKYKDAWTHYNTAYAHDPKNKVLLQNMEKLRKAELRQKTSCHRQQENLTKSIA